MQCEHGKYAVPMFAGLCRYMNRRAYHPDIYYDVAELDKVKQLVGSQSVVFLVTHKTYLDFFVLYDFFYSNGMMPPFIFGGINMAFSGFGNFARHAGGLFIRRSFRDDPVYRAVLRRYIAFLVEQQSSFMWAIEGTRSRTGKLVMPKMGLLKYVVDATEGLGEEDIAYVPVSVSYDQIPDVIGMAAQESGAVKNPESLSWFVNYIRGLGDHFGNTYVRFGDTIGLHDTPDAPDLAASAASLDAHTIEVQKLAFEVCYRINEITPTTLTSLILMSLLCRTSTSSEQISADVHALRNYITSRQSSALFRDPSHEIEDDTDLAIRSLIAKGVVQLDKTDAAHRYSIVPDRYLVALYYSNMAVHHFVIAAFVELGLLNIVQGGSDGDHSAFWSEILRLRDIFKYEFFFSRKEQFRRQITAELDFLDASMDTLCDQDRSAAEEVLRRQPLLVAHGVLSPYINAYRVVSDCLVRAGMDAVHDRDAFIGLCQAESRNAGTGAGYPGFASKALLTSGLLLADNRGLLESGQDVIAGRRQFDDKLRQISLQLDEIRRLTNSLSIS